VLKRLANTRSTSTEGDSRVSAVAGWKGPPKKTRWILETERAARLDPVEALRYE
jgi:hypothetical protein